MSASSTSGLHRVDRLWGARLYNLHTLFHDYSLLGQPFPGVPGHGSCTPSSMGDLHRTRQDLGKQASNGVLPSSMTGLGEPALIDSTTSLHN